MTNNTERDALIRELGRQGLSTRAIAAHPGVGLGHEMVRRVLNRGNDRGPTSAALVCHRMHSEDELKFWPDRQEAVAAAALIPCDKDCVGAHDVCWGDGERIRVASVGNTTEVKRLIAERDDERRERQREKDRGYAKAAASRAATRESPADSSANGQTPAAGCGGTPKPAETLSADKPHGHWKPVGPYRVRSKTRRRRFRRRRK